MGWTTRFTLQVGKIANSAAKYASITKDFVFSRTFFKAMSVIFATEASTYINFRIISRYQGRAVYYPTAIFLGALSGEDSFLHQINNPIAKYTAITISTLLNGTNTLFSILYTAGTVSTGVLYSAGVVDANQKNSFDENYSTAAIVLAASGVGVYTTNKMRRIIKGSVKSQNPIFSQPSMLASGRSGEAVRPCIYFGSVNISGSFTLAYYNLLLFLSSSFFGSLAYVLYKWFPSGAATFDHSFDSLINFMNLVIAGCGLSSTVNLRMEQQVYETATTADVVYYILPALVIGLISGIAWYKLFDFDYYKQKHDERLLDYNRLPEQREMIDLSTTSTDDQIQSPSQGQDPALFKRADETKTEENHTHVVEDDSTEVERHLRANAASVALSGWGNTK